MRNLVALAFMLPLVGCVTAIGPPQSPTFPISDNAQPPESFVVLPLVDEELVVAAPDHNNLGFYVASGNVLAIILGSALDAQRTNDAQDVAERSQRALRDGMAGFRFSDSLLRSIPQALESEHWQMLPTARPTTASLRDERIEELLRAPDVDAVVVLDGVYQLGGSLERFQVGMLQSIFTHESGRSETGGLLPVHRREFWVHPAERELELRRRTEQETAALEAEIRAQAQGALAADPDNAFKIAMRRDKLLRELDKRQQVAPDVAVVEAWPPDAIRDAIREAEPLLAAMVELDWYETDVIDFETAERRWFKTERNGQLKGAWGVPLATLNDYQILMRRDGDLAAVRVDD